MLIASLQVYRAPFLLLFCPNVGGELWGGKVPYELEIISNESFWDPLWLTPPGHNSSFSRGSCTQIGHFFLA